MCGRVAVRVQVFKRRVTQLHRIMGKFASLRHHNGVVAWFMLALHPLCEISHFNQSRNADSSLVFHIRSTSKYKYLCSNLSTLHCIMTRWPYARLRGIAPRGLRERGEGVGAGREPKPLIARLTL